MTHPVLLANPAYASWLAEREELVRRRATLAEQIATVNAAQAKAEAKHEQAVARAVADGKSIPKPPQPVERAHLDAALQMQQRAEDQHRARRTAVLAEAAATGCLQGLNDRERGRMARAVEMLPTLQELEREAQDDARVKRDLIRAADLQAGLAERPARADRITPPDLQTLLDAAAAGRSLLEPRPVDPSMRDLGMRRIEMVEEGDEATRVPPWRGNGADMWPRVDMRSNRGVEI